MGESTDDLRNDMWLLTDFKPEPGAAIQVPKKKPFQCVSGANPLNDLFGLEDENDLVEYCSFGRGRPFGSDNSYPAPGKNSTFEEHCQNMRHAINEVSGNEYSNEIIEQHLGIAKPSRSLGENGLHSDVAGYEEETPPGFGSEVQQASSPEIFRHTKRKMKHASDSTVKMFDVNSSVEFPPLRKSN